MITPGHCQRFALIVLVLTSLAMPRTARAQKQDKTCHIICAQAFSIWPEIHRSHVGDHPRVKNHQTGAVTRHESQNNLLLYSASDVGEIRANIPAIGAGASYGLVTARETHGFVSVTPHVDDLLSKGISISLALVLPVAPLP